MTGIKHIKIYNKKVSYEFDLERNISIISGDSATGKTTLFNLVRDYEKNKNNGVSLFSNVECLTLNNNDWEYKIEKNKSVVFFIDEKNRFFKTKKFAEYIQKSDSYFVIITRESMPDIPYSIDSIYEITGKKKHKLLKKYDLKNINYWMPRVISDYNRFDSFVVEDSESGFQLFDGIAKKLNKQCKSSNGNSNLYKYVDDKSILVADSAAYGSFIEKTLDAMKIKNDSYIYLPECIEWIILNVIKFSGSIININKIMANAYEYVDSKKHISYEQYYTDLLKNITKNDKVFKYSKKKLNKNYVNDENIKKFIKFIFSK